MRAFQGSGFHGFLLRTLALAGVVAGVGGAWTPPREAQAEEGPAAAPSETLLERAMGALRLRMEAKLKEAALLERQGKLEEALAATREVERLYRETLDDLQRLMKAAPPATPAQRPALVIVPRTHAPHVPQPRRPQVVAPLRPAPTRLVSQSAAAAVEHGLRWLAAHQSPDGRWEAADFDGWCDGKANTGARPDGAGKSMYDVGVTGLALCAFLSDGHANGGEPVFARVVQRGLAYLKSVQDPEGCFGPRSTQHFIYNHATAALAMIEAYGSTQNPLYRESAQQALNFIALARNPYFTWRYGVKPGDNDTSVTGWMAMALESARNVNREAERQGGVPTLVVDEEAADGVLSWLDKMTDPDYGRVGYAHRGGGVARPQDLVDRFPAEKSEAMTAVALLLRLQLGQTAQSTPAIAKGFALLRKLPPTWNLEDGSIDMYYWYYGTLATQRAGGPDWTAWDRALQSAVVSTQRQDGTYCEMKGSWQPADPWGPDGGRVYSTALMTLCCAVSARNGSAPR